MCTSVCILANLDRSYAALLVLCARYEGFGKALRTCKRHTKLRVELHPCLFLKTVIELTKYMKILISSFLILFCTDSTNEIFFRLFMIGWGWSGRGGGEGRNSGRALSVSQVVTASSSLLVSEPHIQL